MQTYKLEHEFVARISQQKALAVQLRNNTSSNIAWWHLLQCAAMSLTKLELRRWPWREVYCESILLFCYVFFFSIFLRTFRLFCHSWHVLAFSAFEPFRNLFPLKSSLRPVWLQHQGGCGILALGNQGWHGLVMLLLAQHLVTKSTHLVLVACACLFVARLNRNR